MNLKKCFVCLMTYIFQNVSGQLPPRKIPPSLNYPRTITKGINIFFFCYQNGHIQNLFEKLSISKIQCSNFEIWDCKWLKTLNVTPSFTALILLLLFQFIKICLCYEFSFYQFFLFSYGHQCPCDKLINFFKHQDNCVFSIFWFCFPMVAWWK